MKKIILFLQLIFSIGMSAQTTVESVQVADIDKGAPICGKSIDLHKRILIPLEELLYTILDFYLVSPAETVELIY